MIKIETTQINLSKQMDMTIKLPQYIVNIFEKLSKWSGRSKEQIISRFIFCELEVFNNRSIFLFYSREKKYCLYRGF